MELLHLMLMKSVVVWVLHTSYRTVGDAGTVKLSPCTVGRHMGGLEVLRHLFLISALDGDEWVDFIAGLGIFFISPCWELYPESSIP